MKTIIRLFIFLFLCSVAYSQTNTITKYEATDYLETIIWYVTDVDSAETAESVGFGAEEFINNFLLAGNDSTAKCYAEVYVNGTGSVDSLSLLTLSGLNVNGAWIVFDTLATNKATAKRTLLSFHTLPYFTQWRIDATGADLTASGYDMIVRVKLICPKRREI